LREKLYVSLPCPTYGNMYQTGRSKLYQCSESVVSGGIINFLEISGDKCTNLNFSEYSSSSLIIWGYRKHGYKINLSVHTLISAKFFAIFP